MRPDALVTGASPGLGEQDRGVGEAVSVVTHLGDQRRGHGRSDAGEGQEEWCVGVCLQLVDVLVEGPQMIAVHPQCFGEQ